MLSMILMEKNVGTFHKNEFQKQIKKCRIEKGIKRKDEKLYVTWKGCVSSYNKWIEKNDSINVKVELDLSLYANKKKKTDLKKCNWS